MEIAERAQLAHLREIALPGGSATQWATEFLRQKPDAAAVALARRLVDPGACAAACLADLRPSERVLELRTATWTRRAPFVQQLGGQVEVAETSAERLEISRAWEPEIPHTLLQHWPQLPYPPETFDTVLCHGGLPSSLAMEEVVRVLKPGGTVSLSGPNRLSPALDWGTRRGIVQSLSPAGYRRLLAAAGLVPSSGLALFPDDLLPSYALPFAAPAVPGELWSRICREQFAPLNRTGWRQGLKTLAASLAIWQIGRQLAPGVSVFGEKPGERVEPARSLLERMATHALGDGAQPLLLLVRLTHAAVAPVYRPDAQDLVYLKIALSPYGAESLARHERFLRDFPRAMREIVPVPDPVAAGRFQNLPYYAESGLPGMGGGRARLPLELLEQSALALLSRWQAATKQSEVGAMRQRWQRRIDAMRSHALLADPSAYAALADWATTRLQQVDCAVVAHNDFHLGNVIYSPEGKVTGVLDWDLADREGLPYCDALHLLISSLLRHTSQPKVAVIRSLLAGNLPVATRPLNEHCQQLGISGQAAFWLPLYVVTQLWRLTIQAGYSLPGTTLYERMERQATELIELALAEGHK
jgi:SAM-dependent methyltransferase